MNIEDFRDYCLSLEGVCENAPWRDPKYSNLITFTIGGKWFSLLDLDNKRANLKCPSTEIPRLREEFDGCVPAWHMNKSHWIGVLLDSDLSDSKIKELIFQAYKTILGSLPKRLREEFMSD